MAFGHDGGREKETGGAEPRPYTRLPMTHTFFMRRDAPAGAELPCLPLRGRWREAPEGETA